MHLEEMTPGAFSEVGGAAPDGEVRIQATAAWLSFAASFPAAIGGPGARLDVLVASEEAGPVAALPILRLPAGRGRLFPLDLEDFFFGQWIRNVDPADRELRLRSVLSGAFGAILSAGNPALRRPLVVHDPLSPVSVPLMAPGAPRERTDRALRLLLDRSRDLAAAEGRCAFLPRVPRGGGAFPEEALSGWLRVPGYPVAEYDPLAPLARRVRQMVSRNRRLMEGAGVSVEITRGPPGDVPFQGLFEATARRHKDPVPGLCDAFFRELAERFAPRVRWLVARRGGATVGFLAVLEHGPRWWEAFKCGADRAASGRAPVYLDMLYGRLRELAAQEGIRRVELGPGDIDVKLHYGSVARMVDGYVALPPGFRGRALFEAYLQAVGDGIARWSGAPHRGEG